MQHVIQSSKQQQFWFYCEKEIPWQAKQLPREFQICWYVLKAVMCLADEEVLVFHNKFLCWASLWIFLRSQSCQLQYFLGSLQELYA